MIKKDGSRHEWLALRPTERAVLIEVLDVRRNACSTSSYGRAKRRMAILKALRDVIVTQGLPMAVYTDRAHWATIRRRKTVTSNGASSRRSSGHWSGSASSTSRPTRRRRAAAASGSIGRSRIGWSTSSASRYVTTLTAPNAYLRERFVEDYNATFSCEPADPARDFVNLVTVDIEQILCQQKKKLVERDNTVAFEGRIFQLEQQPGRSSSAGLEVTVRRHLTGEYSFWPSTRRLGHYPAVHERPRDRRTAVQPMEAAAAVDDKNA